MPNRIFTALQKHFFDFILIHIDVDPEPNHARKFV
jgi:hypothetical protein